MVTIGPNNISIKGLRDKWSQSNFLKVDGTSGTGPGLTNISLSSFRDALFTDETNVPESGSISIKDHFRNKIFGSGDAEGSNNSFTTSDFNFNDDFSGEADRLYPVAETELTEDPPDSTSSSKYARLLHSNVSYSYPSILLCPQAGDPTIGTEDDATVWIKMKLNSPYHFQIGIIHKQGESTWENVASNALRNRHTTYNDRIALHTYGYVTHAGHDIESSTKTDELLDIQITNETTDDNYHNRIGTTAGSGSGFGTVSNTYYYLQSDVDFYQSKTSTSSDYYIGMKVNYYEITLTGTVSNNSKLITNVKLNNSNLTEDDDVYSGMYLSSTQSDPYFPSEAIIQSVRYNTSNYTEIDMGDEINGSVDKTYGYYGSTITFKAVGQRLEFQYACDCGYSSPKNIGPNHIILPRKYRTSSNGSNLDIDSWAFFVGDSTGWGNSGTFTIQSANPNPNLYSITYDFSGQTAITNTGNWSPEAGTKMSDWVNGTGVVNGDFWTSNKSVKGWNLSNDTDSNSTPSSYTGPAGGGYNGSTGFMYTEVSSSRHLYVFVCRTPAFNFSTLMEDTSNDLKLKFKVHAYGLQIGDLFVHISTDSSTTASASTQLASYTSFSGFNEHSSDWQTKEISLNSYRTVNSNHYIYFASYNATYWRGDLSVDYVQICEETSS